MSGLAETSPSPAKAFLEKYCFECHDADSRKGKIQLDGPELGFSKDESVEIWGKVFRQLVQKEMPPPAKKTQPSMEEREAILDWLGTELLNARKAHPLTEAPLRRLNRVEYQNTIQDLLGVDMNLTDLLPEDGISQGFDKVATALALSPVQMEKYLEAADVALNPILDFGPQPQWFHERYEGKDVVDRWELRSFRILDNSGAAVLFNSAESPTDVKKFRAPEPGHYRARISACGYQTKGSPMKFRVYGGNFASGGKTKLFGYFEVPADKPTVMELVVRLEDKRDTLKIAPYGCISWHNDDFHFTGPGLAVQWLEVEGPLEATNWPSAVSRKLLGDLKLDEQALPSPVSSPQGGKDAGAGGGNRKTVNGRESSAAVNQTGMGEAEKVLRTFAARAFRRPVSDEVLAPYLRLMQERRDQGGSLREALRVGLKSVLVSPRFLLLGEKAEADDEYVLASRLSYFLWSTMPDAELLQAAEQHELSKPEILHAEVERMLNDPRAERFTIDFTGQWLGLRNIDFTTPDARLYPEFDELLQISMVKETQAFFDELLKNDLSVLNFIDSDFAMLNDRLARHYGFAGIEGIEIRKVKLPKNSHRGGILTQGSVLKVSANGTTTSPVIRGSWVLQRIMGKTVPPPPPNVPAAEPDIRGALSIRDQLVRHRANPACAGCHAKFDPIGFALESYDVIGGWRDRYRISPQPDQHFNYAMLSIMVNQREKKVALGKNVDTADRMPNGKIFANIDGLKAILMSDPDQIARGLAEKLLVYATGRAIEPCEQPMVREMVKRVKEKNYGFRTLVHEVVASDIFKSN